jgi:hypothetical protein
MIRVARLLLLALAVATIGAAAERPGDIRIGASETYPRAITSWNGTVEIRGVVTDTVLLFGGRLVLSGEIRGDLVCIGTQVEILDNARLGRDVIVIGGTLQRAESSRIQGEFFYIRTREDFKKILSSLLPFLPGTGGLFFFKIVKTVFWLIIMLLVLAVFPRQVADARERFQSATWRCGAVGLLGLFAFLFLLVIFVILSFVLIGIPLLLLLIVLYFVVLLFGRTVVLSQAGRHALRLLGVRAQSPVAWLVGGALLYAGLKFLPLLGLPLLVIVDIFALGVGFLSLPRPRCRSS